ncbi:MAG TPA: DUF559 domain-containing protein [Stellaceae bacterium]|nr:DUF559 domain-containing protein [Stellaceae bacterium]
MANVHARRLRRETTDAERRLWEALRDRRLAGYRFRRQHPIGGFIVDFACIKYRLVLEADGSQHAESQADEARTASLQKGGWRVLRFWNNDIFSNKDRVLQAILAALEADAPSPGRGQSPRPPSPAMRERVVSER